LPRCFERKRVPETSEAEELYQGRVFDYEHGANLHVFIVPDPQFALAIWKNVQTSATYSAPASLVERSTFSSLVFLKFLFTLTPDGRVSDKIFRQLCEIWRLTFSRTEFVFFCPKAFVRRKPDACVPDFERSNGQSLPLSVQRQHMRKRVPGRLIGSSNSLI